MTYLASYAGALRCVGQELQRRNIDVFELKSRSDAFSVQGGDPHPPYTSLVNIKFSRETLLTIDREGRRRRGQAINEIRFDSVPEVLRAVGEYIDKKHGSLRSLNNSVSSSEPTLELEYRSRAGEIESETLTIKFIRDACVRMYQRRMGQNEVIRFRPRKH